MEFCPYLGKEDDPATPILFPSPSNRCFRTEKGIQLETDYQSICCLTREYRQCPVFLDASRIDLLPAQQIRAAERNLRRLNVIFFSLLLLFIFGVVVLLVNLGLIPNIPFLKLDVPVPLITTQTFDPNTGSGARDLLLKSSPTPIVELTATLLATTNQPSPTPHPITATPTKTAQPPPAVPAPAEMVKLDTPFGGEQKFILHRVVSGESISLFAMQNSSSVEVIQWANYGLTSPLQINILLVIPVGLTVIDPDMPAFEVYHVTDSSVVAQDLAEDLKTDVDQFLQYNNLNGGQTLPSGSWVIVPRPHQP
jgi:hypothetical protein